MQRGLHVLTVWAQGLSGQRGIFPTRHADLRVARHSPTIIQIIYWQKHRIPNFTERMHYVQAVLHNSVEATDHPKSAQYATDEQRM